MATGMLFFGLIAAYVTLAKLYSSPLVGLLLPAGSTVAHVVAMLALVHSFDTFYYQPKEAFLVAQLALSAQSRTNAVPPLLGDIERPYGYTTAMFAVIIDNAGSVANLVGAMLAPASTAWVLSFAVSAALEVLARTGVQQRAELWFAARLAAQLGWQWPAQTNALELVYLRSLGGAGYLAPTMLLCIGCVRALSFGDPRAIVWLDVSPGVWQVLLAQLSFEVLADVVSWAAERKGLQQFELSARYAAGHPLRNLNFRTFDLPGYAFTFAFSGAFIYAVFIAFLGPAFVTGMCRDFAPNATHVWIVGPIECTATALGGPGLVNETLPAVGVQRP
jgi:hypothetical protein